MTERMAFLWVQDQQWRANAACRDMDTNDFFLHDERHGVIALSEKEVNAKKVCGECPVQSDCLDYAIKASEPLGIWGGMDTREREKERRKRERER